MKKVKTAKGRVIDMAAMVAANEAQRAVGNVHMNAKGDRLDKGGKVVATVQRVARKQADEAQPVVTAPISNPTKNKTAVKTAPKVEEYEPAILTQSTKQREDGTVYIEVEYDDGSIETRELTPEELKTLNTGEEL